MTIEDNSLRQQRLYGALRTALIGYGIAAFTLLSWRMDPADELGLRTGASTKGLLLWGLAVQVALIVARRVISRRLDKAVAAQALLLLELLGDAASVLFFALGTFGAIYASAGGI